MYSAARRLPLRSLRMRAHQHHARRSHPRNIFKWPQSMSDSLRVPCPLTRSHTPVLSLPLNSSPCLTGLYVDSIRFQNLRIPGSAPDPPSRPRSTVMSSSPSPTGRGTPRSAPRPRSSSCTPPPSGTAPRSSCRRYPVGAPLLWSHFLDIHTRLHAAYTPGVTSVSPCPS
jgi:hypothetical protein